MIAVAAAIADPIQKRVVFLPASIPLRMVLQRSSSVERVDDGFRVHLQAEGQPMSPWYEVVLTR